MMGKIFMWFAVTVVPVVLDAMKGIIGRILITLGIGTVTAVGVNALLQTALQYAQFGSMGNSQLQAVVNAVGIPWLMSTLVSAVSTRLVVQGLMSDAVSFWVMRRQIG